MRVRYVGPIEDLEVVPPPPHPAFVVKRLVWVDVPADVAGKRPSSPTHHGEGLLAQGDWVDGEFDPLWETEAAKKAAATRAAHDKEA